MVLENNSNDQMGSVFPCSCSRQERRPSDPSTSDAYLPIWTKSRSSSEEQHQWLEGNNHDESEDVGASRRRSTNSAENGILITNELKFNIIQAAADGDLDFLIRNKDLIKGQLLADYDRRTPLHLAATEGHLNVVKFLIEEISIDPDFRDRNKKTALDEAVKGNHMEVAEYLKLKTNNTAFREKHEIIEAAMQGDLGLLKIKCAMGVNLSVSNYDQRTPLHLAAAEGHITVVKFLIEECKVDTSAKDRFGQTALDEAQKNRRHDIVGLIRRHQQDNF